MHFLFAALITAAVVVGALWRSWLTRGGAVGAWIVGTVTFGLGGPAWGLLLVLFFITSSALSHFKEAQKKAVAEKFAKGSRRDFAQVMANGGAGAVLASLSVLVPWSGWLPMFVGVVATVNADTWATELGTLSRHPPRLITTGRRVDPGTSGAISSLGTLASLLGAVLIGLAAGLLPGELGWRTAILVGSIGGLAGSLCDSLLGATAQGINYCDRCQEDTEADVHRCGYVTRRVRGWAWLNNDAVNLVASVAGGLTALGLWLSLSLGAA